jgi:hypothetical protein
MVHVEEYACDESVEQLDVENDEVLALVERLGLEGQGKLKTNDGLMPYPEMTADQKFILDVLTPSHVNIKKYQRTAIPLRILQIAAHADSLGFFESLQVWDTAGVDKDPILVGCKAYNEYYLLARWGEHLDNWTLMYQKATEKAKNEMTGKLSQLLSDVQSRLARLKSGAFSHDDLVKAGY